MLYMSSTFSMYALGLAGSRGTEALTAGFGFAFPFLGHGHPLFEVAHAGEILVEARTVAGTDFALKILRLVSDGVEDAFAEFEMAHLVIDFLLRARHEETPENIGGFFFARNHHARTGPGKAALALLDVHPKREGLKAGEMADAFADILIKRNGVAETARGPDAAPRLGSNYRPDGRHRHRDAKRH